MSQTIFAMLSLPVRLLPRTATDDLQLVTISTFQAVEPQPASQSEVANAGLRTDHTHKAGRLPVPVCGRVLMVAYHFPPQAGSSGLLRSLKFCRYLPEFGWMPTVLTVHPRAYERVHEAQLAEVPADVRVIRAFGLDTRRHLAVREAYPRLLALPDRWISWLPAAVTQGLYTIKTRDIDAIFTTFPIATAVLVGYLLHRMTGKPWIVDLRDSMTEDNYPADRLTRRVYRWIEAKAVRHAAKILFTAPAAIRMYCQRYPELDADKCMLLPNGYDESDFEGIVPRRTLGRQIRLLHSGLIYPWERDPRPFFRALARLKAEGQISAETLSVELRACGAEDEFRQQVDALGIGDLVYFLPPIPYRASLQDCADADALLLLQAACCDHQIPAKAYEYLRSNKPMLALTTSTGDTAALLRETGGATVIDLADENALHDALPEFLRQVRSGTHPVPLACKAKSFSRRDQSARLAECLSSVATVVKKQR
jgi:glycosyltransferase involved in cell wall biosynthesis